MVLIACPPCETTNCGMGITPHRLHISTARVLPLTKNTLLVKRSTSHSNGDKRDYRHKSDNASLLSGLAVRKAGPWNPFQQQRGALSEASVAEVGTGLCVAQEIRSFQTRCIVGRRRYAFDEAKVQRFIAEGRGAGTRSDYVPWLKITDVPSIGRSRRLFSPKTGRIHHLLSDGEWKTFLKEEADPNTRKRMKHGLHSRWRHLEQPYHFPGDSR